MRSDIVASHLPKALLQKLHKRQIIRTFTGVKDAHTDPCFSLGFGCCTFLSRGTRQRAKKPSRREQIQETSRYGLQRNNLPGNRESRWLGAEKNLLASSHSWRDYQIFQVSIATKQVTPKLSGLHNHLFGIGICNWGRSWWGQLISSPCGLTGVG